MSLLFNRFPNKIAPDAANDIQRNHAFCSFASFPILSITSFFNKLDSSRDLTIFMIALISLFETVNVAISDPKPFF